MKRESKYKRICPAISPAGMNKDDVRRDTNAPLPNDESIEAELEWRREHRQ